MKKILMVSVLTLAAGWSNSASAVHGFQGSDTLSGVMSDAIIAAGMNNEIAYLGGGTGKGEEGIVKGDQGIAPMSREMKPEMMEKGKVRGATFVPRVIALDGLSIFVNKTNATSGIDIPTIEKVFTCVITDWRDIPGSGKSGRINVFRRNDASGTTDAFKAMVGVKKFGDCVTALQETADIADKTSTDANAIAYSGHTATRDKNKALSVSRGPGQPMVAPNVNTVRNFSYPLSRKLFVYEVSGAVKPNATEVKFMRKILDRSFLDPIIQNNEFYTIN